MITESPNGELLMLLPIPLAALFPTKQTGENHNGKENDKLTAQTLFQFALFNCTSCLYFFFGATPGGNT